MPVILLASIYIVSCSNYSLFVEVMDSAGSNRSELETVLDHYRIDDPNPEKYKAAEYIIENLSAHYSYSGTKIQEYYGYAASILSDTSLTPEQQRDSLLEKTDRVYKGISSCTVPDAQIIKSGFLIENIDKSYQQWQTCPWARQLSYDEYLEWLLPYKAVELQELDCWRDTLLVHFCSGLDNPVKNDVEYNTTVGVADMIRRDTYNSLNRYGLYTRSGLPLLSAQLLVRQTYGDIPDYAITAVLAFRAAGIPAVLDETPVGSRNTAAVKWFVIKSDRGEELRSEWDLSTMIGGGFFPYERGPKVYRNTYSINRKRLDYKRKAKYKYPFELGKDDVTDRYFLTSNLTLPIEKAVRKCLKDKYVYIASAVRDNQNPWQIVDFGILRHGKACFENMGREVLYCVFGFDGEELIPITSPFILHKDQSCEYVCSDTIGSTALNKWKNNKL